MAIVQAPAKVAGKGGKAFKGTRINLILYSGPRESRAFSQIGPMLDSLRPDAIAPESPTMTYEQRRQIARELWAVSQKTVLSCWQSDCGAGLETEIARITARHPENSGRAAFNKKLYFEAARRNIPVFHLEAHVGREVEGYLLALGAFLDACKSCYDSLWQSAILSSFTLFKEAAREYFFALRDFSEVSRQRGISIAENMEEYTSSLLKEFPHLRKKEEARVMFFFGPNRWPLFRLIGQRAESEQGVKVASMFCDMADDDPAHVSLMEKGMLSAQHLFESMRQLSIFLEKGEGMDIVRPFLAEKRDAAIEAIENMFRKIGKADAKKFAWEVAWRISHSHPD